LKAVVTSVAPGAGTPTGNVQFVDTSNSLIVATVPLAAGAATTTVSPSTAARPIAAAYSGDNNFKGSSSAPLPVPVSAAGAVATTFAPDELVSLYNVTGLSGDTPATLPLAHALGGVSVSITDSTGTTNAASLYGVFGSTGQINFVIPGNTAAGLALLTVALPGGANLTAVANIANTAPGIFASNMNGAGVYAGQVVYVHPDGSQTMTNPATFDAAQNRFVPNPIAMGSPGDQVFLILYGTGFRHAASVTATVNGVQVNAVFAAQPQYPGLDQLNLQLGPSLAGAGLVNIIVTADGQAANAVTALIQ
jgi:uncharacterized protein (TIGR03437 family)